MGLQRTVSAVSCVLGVDFLTGNEEEFVCECRELKGCRGGVPSPTTDMTCCKLFVRVSSKHADGPLLFSDFMGLSMSPFVVAVVGGSGRAAAMVVVRWWW